MSEDKVYKDGDIVWVKLGNNWWPGEVTGPTRHPEGLIKHLKRGPYCVVKFFNENTYEYVRSSKQIFPFECHKQEEFIRKGFSLYNSGNSFMEKFPSDVQVAKQLTRRKESALIINDRPDSIVKAILGQPLIRSYDEYYDESEYREKRRSGDSVTKILNITQNRNNDGLNGEKPLFQKPTTLNLSSDRTKNVANAAANNNSSNYQCNFCNFSSVRLNVMLMHRKMHNSPNSSGSSNSSSSPSKPNNSKSRPFDVATTVATTTINNDRNQNSPKGKNAKTKVSTITAAAERSAKMPLLLKEATTAPVIPLTSNEKTNRTTIQTPNKSKIGKKGAESAYATILSDFCPDETETTPTEERPSRRSLRHCKNTTESGTEKVTTICIDLSETKTIQKIPKKREYSSLLLQNESLRQIVNPVVTAEPDVVCLGDKEKEITTITSSNQQSSSTKEDAEDIRRMLLADWSDEDETPTDAIVVSDTVALENAESNVCSSEPANEILTSTSAVVTSTPVFKPSTVSSGRIRNIPKKDRRDVVLQDFNSDLSIVHSDNVDQATKDVALDLDSSNSSVVEIIENLQPATIITINDDEDQENSKSQNDIIETIVTGSKDNDSAVGLINDKSTSAATSVTTLSCFDFQDDEDEHDNTTTTISHFKKKYLSSDKLQNLSTTTTTTNDLLKEDHVAKNRDEMAEKDQRLAAEIETLLEQTQPTVADLLNANSFEESIAVKDLPIKERGKRIFKSRNRNRMDDTKTNPEVAVVTNVEVSLSKPAQAKEEYNSNVSETAATGSLDNKDANEIELEPTIEKENEMINNKCLLEISNTDVEIPKLMEDKQLTPNENKENEDLSTQNKDCSEIRIGDCNVSEDQNGQIENVKIITSESKDESIGNAEIEDSRSKYQQGNHEGNDDASFKLLIGQEDIIVQQPETVEKNPQQTPVASEKPAARESFVSETGNNDCDDIRTNTQTVLDKTGSETISAQSSDVKNVENSDASVNKVKVLEIIIFEKSKGNLKDDLENGSAKNTLNRSLSADKELKSFLPIADEANDSDENQKQNSENIFKIRVKSPEELLDQAFVIASQQEHELQPIVDTNVDARLITITPTDENSSMCASDTGAEFGSPTSMLSEERLPVFRFQSNQTPQQEIEKAETELQIKNLKEQHEKDAQPDDTKIPTNAEVKENFLRNQTQFDKDFHQKPLLQRRLSMDLNSLQTEPKSQKRQRLSVDAITTSPEKNVEKTPERTFTAQQKKCEGRARSKNRHMKITPRRNVGELFKEHLSTENCVPKAVQNNRSDGIKEIQSSDNDPANEIRTEIDTQVKKANYEATIDTNVISENIENKISENPKEQLPKNSVNKDAKLRTSITSVEEREDVNIKRVETIAISNQNQTSNNQDENQENIINSKCTEDYSTLNKGTNDSNTMEDKSAHISTEADGNINNLNIIENIEISPPEIPIKKNLKGEENKNSAAEITLPLDNCKAHREKVLKIPVSPVVKPTSPREQEVVEESENQNINTQEEVQANVEAELNMTITPLALNENENSEEVVNQQLLSPRKTDKLLNKTGDKLASPKEKGSFGIEVVCPLILLDKDPINGSAERSVVSENEKSTSECEALTEPPQAEDMVIEFETNVVLPCISNESNIGGECESVLQIPSTPQAKDLIIECEPSTPQDIIECDHNLPARITPEKQVIVESDVVIATSTHDKDIIIEENLQLEEKETLLERELQVIQPKENSASIEVQQEPQPTTLQTDADKAAEEFLIEFDNIVNHSHTVEENIQNSAIKESLNADDLINNIIEEVHDDQPKEDTPVKSESPIPFDHLTTYTVVANKNSWNQIFKESFRKQLAPVKRRQTICFEISDTKEGTVCKKQALDCESIPPVNKSSKRTAERKLTLPAIETKPHNIITLSHNQLTKRKLSIEDNITSFIIERPKQQQVSTNTKGGPPPLQRIRPLSRQGHIISKANTDNLSEPPPLQNHESLFNDLFQSEPASPTQKMETIQKSESGRVIHQQILTSPVQQNKTTVHQNKTTDGQISINKQIGVDSRGNKYVIIKTPPTDIIVQPTLTASAVSATNNFGTTITIQPLTRSSTKVSTTKGMTKTKNIASPSTASVRKQQQPQQQQMKQISITVPAKSQLEISNSPELLAKTQSRNRRKVAQGKSVATPASTNSNINSAKHRQAMEALSRRLSIATEAPPLAKISRTSSTNLHTQISNNSNVTYFADTQITSIAQQQLIQLQHQQQQQTPTAPSQLPPPIILNKNAHQQTIMQRKARKISQQQQQQQQLQVPQQQIQTPKSTQLVEQQPESQMQQQQNQQMQQQQFITQIPSQQQHDSLQLPPLQQIQPQAVPMQQQIVQQNDGIIITAATEDDNVIDSNTQLIALPTQPYPGYSETFLLCKVKGNTYKPVNNVPLYLNQQLNELVPVPLEAIEGGHKPLEHQIEIKASNAQQQNLLTSNNNEPQDGEGNLEIANINCNLVEGEISAGIETDHQIHQHNQQQQIIEESGVDESCGNASSNQLNEFAANQEVNTELVSNNGILLNIEGQQVLLDAATFAHLLANPDANTQLISDDGTEYVLTHEVLAALQMQQEQQQALELAQTTAAEQQEQNQGLKQAGSTDIIAVALAGSELYDNDVLTIDTSQGMQLIDGDGSIVFPSQTGAITQQHLTPPAVVTNAVLDQSPIMSTLEVPSSISTAHKLQGSHLITVPSHHLAASSNAALGVGGRTNLEDSLAAIGVTTQSSGIPSSLGLPITVTNPNIASKVTSAGPLNEMLQFVSHRPVTAAATAAAVAAAALAGESRIFTD